MVDGEGVQIRGIYSTALTALLAESHSITTPSESIRNRFSQSFQTTPGAISIRDTHDRMGIELTSYGVTPFAIQNNTGLPVAGSLPNAPPETDESGQASIFSTLLSIAPDVFCWIDPVADGAILTGTVQTVERGHARLETPAGEVSVPVDAVDAYLEAGDEVTTQVRRPMPPWSERDPLARPGIELAFEALTLTKGDSGVTARGRDATEIVGLTDLLSAGVPDGWGLEWEATAADLSIEAMDQALERASSRARELEQELPTNGWFYPRATVWSWFGHTAREALDEARRDVTQTMGGHHRLKTVGDGAGTAVDFLEALESVPSSFPIQAMAASLGPSEGSTVAIRHGKPTGEAFSLGRATVTSLSAAGEIELERELSSSGTYDGIGTPREPGDIATTHASDGQWWYLTNYTSEDGSPKGTYANVCTPLEIRPDEVSYVDLYIDVVKAPDDLVEIVDSDELAEAVEDGYLTEELAERARSVAESIASGLSAA